MIGTLIFDCHRGTQPRVSSGISHSRSPIHASPLTLCPPTDFFATKHVHTVFQDIDGLESRGFRGTCVCARWEYLAQGLP